ncbi:MAG TPA: hypothetical protein VFY23_05795 [Candidatus Limnocylindrales bacterium]|nr:hypothetical protein [Candidatus Limnocylindrales bacterium]
MSLVLVVARPPRPARALASVLDAVRAPFAGETPSEPAPDADAAAEDAAARTDVWRAVRAEVASLHEASGAAVTPRRLDALAAAIEEDPDDPTVSYAGSPDEALEAVRARIADGAAAVAVVPVALAVEDAEGSLRDPDLLELHRRLDELGREHPGVELQYVGPPFDHAPALEAAVAALRPAGSEEPALLTGAIERAFGGDLERFARFMAALQAGVPVGTRLVLRGSAVQGSSYKTGEPFDAKGPGTSDLDVVLLGEEAMAAWAPEAFYLPGVNTQPLYDDAPDIADPALEEARRQAQEAAGRPVALQAMARWFLDLRSGLQGTPYVVLGG